MSKKLFTFVILISLTLTGCVPYAPDVFTPFLQGAEMARRDNERDRLYAIAYDIDFFNQTGDYRALCHAAALGSVQAALYLDKNRVGCETYEIEGKKFIKAVSY
ncbi:MAG: hypothetical protein LBI10_03340 [Deltaproteobacteria bacterium]|jgi:hypothetical protein|nr:hypothetical protein [Deltaproteobacteria bacterium]